MKIAVTAASGRLGTAVLPVLSEAIGPENVVAVVRDPEKVRVPDIEIRKGDYRETHELTDAFCGIDTVLMIAAPIISGSDRLMLHRNVIDAACSTRVRKIVYASVIGHAVDESALFYPIQQVGRQTEELVKTSGLEWIIARNGFYLDLDLAHIQRANEDDGIYRNNAGQGRCGYISIAELATGLARLSTCDECNGEIVNLTGETVTQDELVAIANAAFDLNVSFEPISTEQCLENFFAMPAYAARGEVVIRMLAGLFDGIANGTFDVKSDFGHAAGRPPKPLGEQMKEIYRSL
jgi:NAD(P)H dehydrogenase (quinone)